VKGKGQKKKAKEKRREQLGNLAVFGVRASPIPLEIFTGLNQYPPPKLGLTAKYSGF